MNQFQTKICTVGYLRLNEYLILNWPCFWWGIFITLDAASEVLLTLLKRWSPFGHSIWVVWGELKLAPTWSKGVWKPGVCGGEGLFAGADPMVVSDYFLPPLFHPLYYFHPDSKISSTDLFLYCWEPLKIITETIAAHLKTFWDAVWTTEAARPQRAEAVIQASKNGCWELLWLLVEMVTLPSDSLHVQIPSVHCPAFV